MHAGDYLKRAFSLAFNIEKPLTNAVAACMVAFSSGLYTAENLVKQPVSETPPVETVEKSQTEKMQNRRVEIEITGDPAAAPTAKTASRDINPKVVVADSRSVFDQYRDKATELRQQIDITRMNTLAQQALMDSRLSEKQILALDETLGVYQTVWFANYADECRYQYRDDNGKLSDVAPKVFACARKASKENFLATGATQIGVTMALVLSLALTGGVLGRRWEYEFKDKRLRERDAKAMKDPNRDRRI